jgi:hypothetical protein
MSKATRFELNPVALDPIYGPDVDAVGADYFHVFFDFGHFGILDVDRQRVGIGSVQPA